MLSLIGPHPSRTQPFPTAFLGLSLLLIALSSLAEEALDEGQRQGEIRACLVCHGMETIAYRDPETAEILDLFIDRERYAQSNHAALACTGCHKPSYRQYPHRHGSADEGLHCGGCHDDDPKFERYRFEAIKTEFERSVHVRGNADGGAAGQSPRKALTCFSCHNAHVFRVTQPAGDLAAIVAGHNRVCTTCHAKLQSALSDSHAWLPHREAHWRSVRCLDCHTPLTDIPSHEILPAGQGVRSCDDCHSRESTLLNQLYSYRAEQAIARQGLISMAVFYQAYVVGMSRNPWIDRLALGLAGLMLVGLAAHGVGRYLAYRAKRNQS
jgi:hypothetical protein